MGSSFGTNPGLYGLLLDVRVARDTHLGILAFIPDQVNQVSVAESRVLQEDGPSAMREVSSAYWSKLVLHG